MHHACPAFRATPVITVFTFVRHRRNRFLSLRHHPSLGPTSRLSDHQLLPSRQSIQRHTLFPDRQLATVPHQHNDTWQSWPSLRQTISDWITPAQSATEQHFQGGALYRNTRHAFPNCSWPTICPQSEEHSLDRHPRRVSCCPGPEQLRLPVWIIGLPGVLESVCRQDRFSAGSLVSLTRL